MERLLHRLVIKVPLQQQTQPHILVSIIKDICRQHQIEFIALKNQRVLQLQAGGRTRFIYGFLFDVNNAVSMMLVNDKAAAYSVLYQAGIPAIEHMNFYGADRQLLWKQIHDYFELNQRDLVCKRNMSSGGSSIIRVRDEMSLQETIQRILLQSNSVCLAPYIELKDEYRIIMYQGVPQISFVKIRPFVIGDGAHTLAQLIAQSYPDKKDIFFSQKRRDELECVPGFQEKVLLNWKHNLGLGGTAVLVTQEHILTPLHQLAIQTVNALNIQFCSVDIVDTEKGYQVLEINAGVMMENFARQNEEQFQMARDVYEKVLLDMMNLRR